MRPLNICLSRMQLASAFTSGVSPSRIYPSPFILALTSHCRSPTTCFTGEGDFSYRAV